MVLATERLELIPFTLEQMRLFLRSPRRAGQSVGAVMPRLTVPQWLSACGIYRAKISLMREDPRAWWMATYFQMVRREDRVIVGELGLKGRPRRGRVELGYGVHPGFCNQGYMTEAVAALTAYALRQRDFPVASVTARTKEENAPSRQVLLKCGFTCVGRERGILQWERTLL